ncbi:MAG: PP0621 family protein [Hydrogenophaga sp.]
MKYLLVLFVVLVAVWLWRSKRQGERAAPSPSQRAARPAAMPTPMVACGHCGTHVPQAEAIPGRLGLYCCQEHRRHRGDNG